MELFEKLYREYNDDIRFFLLRLTGYERDLADELVQETFYQAILSFHRFKGDCTIKSWLCQIAKNQYFNAMRTKKRYRSIPLDEKMAASEVLSLDLEGRLGEKELLTLSLEIIRAMDEKTRDVMIYRIFSDMPHSQTAELLHIGESSVKVIYMRGRQKLQKILREDYGYEI